MPKLIAVATALLVFFSCKKGENDPAVSLLSRKARLTGEWRMIAGSASLKGGNVAESYIFDGSNYKRYSTPTGGTPIIYTGQYKLFLKISKDGSFSLDEESYNVKFIASGHWKFNSGVGDTKKKETVIFTIDEVSQGYIYDFLFFNMNSNVFEYKLTELRNKRIVMESASKTYASEKSNNISAGNTYTLTR